MASTLTVAYMPVGKPLLPEFPRNIRLALYVIPFPEHNNYALVTFLLLRHSRCAIGHDFPSRSMCLLSVMSQWSFSNYRPRHDCLP